MQKLAREVRDAHESLEDITMESVQGLEYLHAVLQEGLRMYPPVPSLLPRTTPPEGTVICDAHVPEGVSVGVHQLSAYRCPANFKTLMNFVLKDGSMSRLTRVILETASSRFLWGRGTVLVKIWPGMK